MPLTSTTIAAPDVTLAQFFSGVTFKEQTQRRRPSIDGTWNQGPQSSPLTPLALRFHARRTLARWPSPARAHVPHRRPPPSNVAIIKPTRPDEFQTLFDLRSRKFTAEHCTAVELIHRQESPTTTSAARQTGPRRPCLDLARTPSTSSPGRTAKASPAGSRTATWSAATRRPLPPRRHVSQQLFPVLAVTVDQNINTNTAAIHPVGVRRPALHGA